MSDSLFTWLWLPYHFTVAWIACGVRLACEEKKPARPLSDRMNVGE